MQLFEADLFSDPRPKTSPAPDDASRAVREVLAAHYGALGQVDAAVRQFGGAEINSQNFLVQVGQRPLVAKAAARDLADVLEVVAFARWLHSEVSAVPEIVLSDSGGGAATHGDRTWYVMDWVDGVHFSGAAAERDAAAETIRAVSDVLHRAPMLPTKHFPILGAEDTDLAAELDDRRDEWSAVLGEPTADLLAQHWGELRTVLSEVLGELQGVSPDDGVMHIDLHPHNIIVPAQGPAILLDLDSFQQTSPDVATAFACLKLVRQAISAADERDPAARRDIADEFVERVGASPSRVGSMARSEVLRRIFVLLRLSLHHADRSWNHVLPVHLRALAESRVMFR